MIGLELHRRAAARGGFVTDVAGVATPEMRATMMNGGDFDCSGTFVFPYTDLSTPGGNDCFMSAQTPDGNVRCEYAWSAAGGDPYLTGGAITLSVRGGRVLTVGNAGNTNGQSANMYSGDVVHWRHWYRPSTGESGAMIRVNGIYSVIARGATTGGALAAPTAAWINSYLGSSDSLGSTHSEWVSHTLSDVPVNPSVPLFVSGTSIEAHYGADKPNTAIPCQLIANTDSRCYTDIGYCCAVPGDSISGQTTLMNAATINASAVRLAILAAGINDLAAGTQVATMQTRKLAEIAAAKTKFPNAKIAVVTIGPSRQKFNEIYNASPASFPWAADNTAFWNNVLAYNSWLMGLSVPGTVDYKINSHYAVLGAGTDFLQTTYAISDGGGTFDGSHPNKTGRGVWAAAYYSDAVHPEGIL